MRVFWEGRLVAAPNLNTAGHSKASMGWAIGRLTVTATGARSLLKFADASAGNTSCGAALDAVSLVAQLKTVNGFQVTSSNSAYSVAERQMLAKVQGAGVVPASGTPVCTLQAVSANQVQNGAGLQIVWTIAPSAQFIHETASQRMAGAQLVQQYLTGLLRSSRDLYLAALQADRVPLQGSSDLASWWGVRVQSISTIGSLMSFQIAQTGTTATMTWSNVPGVSSSASEALAPEALANLLYYTKSVAVLPATTTPATTTPGQTCTDPAFTTSAPFGGWTDGNYYVYNNMWNDASAPPSGVGSQTLYACSYSNWYVVSDQPATTDVKTYPNVQENFKSVPVSQFTTLTSSFAETDPHVGIYEDAYDMWLNGIATRTSNEVMIWNENYHQTPGGSPQGTVTFDGRAYTAWTTSNRSYIAFVANSYFTSGTVNLLEFYHWLIDRGWIPSSLGRGPS